MAMCPDCKGSGYETRSTSDGVLTTNKPCKSCNGTGKV